MLYHSYLKFYTKRLLNKKNDAWYFDRMVNAYERKLKHADTGIISWADEMSKTAHNNPPQGYNIHPLYEQGLILRNNCLHEFENKYQANALKVLIQVPPATFSPGGYSWFSNLAVSLAHMGVAVARFWDNLLPADLQNADILLTSSNEQYTDKINWALVNSRQQLMVFSTCDILEKDVNTAALNVAALQLLGIDHFYCFYNHNYAVKSCFYDAAQKKGSMLLSLEFAANPLYHYPVPFAKKTIDWVFLGSANYDKARRYHDYFYPVIQSFNGLIEGPGWPWSGSFSFNQLRDRWVYGRASVALNLHIDPQIVEATELNERTYILAACGIPQVIDNPLLLESYFKCIGYSASSPNAFKAAVKYAIDNYDESILRAGKAMQEVYDQHTTFHRLDNFLKTIVSIRKQIS